MFLQFNYMYILYSSVSLPQIAITASVILAGLVPTVTSREIHVKVIHARMEGRAVLLIMPEATAVNVQRHILDTTVIKHHKVSATKYRHDSCGFIPRS